MTITQSQAQKRFLLIPETLQNVLFSVQTAAIIDQICTDNHLDDKRSDALVEAVGWVLLGFLHPEDIKKELEQSSIPAPVTQDILNSLNAKIFTSLSPLLIKTYAPLPHEEASSGSALLQNANPAPMSIDKTSIANSSASTAQPTFASTPSRPAGIPTPTAPAKPAEPAPMMLHEDTTFKPAQKNEGFTLSKPSAEVEMRAGVPQAPSRPAVLEFGGLKVPIPKPPTPTAESGRYGDFKTSFSSAPSVSTGQRNISQVVPAAPAPVVPKPPILTSVMTPASTVPVPPRPPQVTAQIPQPPKPPAMAQADKPIVKDFL